MIDDVVKDQKLIYHIWDHIWVIKKHLFAIYPGVFLRPRVTGFGPNAKTGLIVLGVGLWTVELPSGYLT